MEIKNIPTFSGEEFARTNYENPKDSNLLTNPSFNDFEIHRIEDHKKNIKFPILPHRKTINDFIYLSEGEICRSKGLDSYTFKANQLFFLPAFNITSSDYASSNARGIYCHFSNNLINNKHVLAFPFFSMSNSPIINISEEKGRQLIPLFSRLFTSDDKNNDLISQYLQIILTELNEDYMPSKKIELSTSAYRITAKFKEALLQQTYSLQTVTDFAELLNISPNHLNKCVKKTTNKTAQDWINEILILEAKVLLRQSNQTISDIALELTRKDPSTFGRFFKNKTGITPSYFRNMD